MFRSLIFSTILTLFFAASAAAQISLPGKVVEVLDGKTVIVSISTGNVKVELQYIEVPSVAQQLGDTVRIHLRNLVLGKIVDYRPRTLLKDRTTGRIALNNVDVSQQMLRDGAAWLIPVAISAQDKSEFDLYAAVEAAAKRDGLGVWAVSGLGPSWEDRANKTVNESQPDKYYAIASTKAPQRMAIPKAGAWSEKDPKLGSVGALMTGYNAETRNGYVSTTLIGLEENKESPPDVKGAIDFTYYYKDDEHKGRKGMVVFTYVSLSKTAHFESNNNLIVIGAGNNLGLGKPKRTTTTVNGNVRETLSYQISKSSLSRLVNDQVYMIIGRQVIMLTGIRYLLYNMVEIAD